MILETIGTKEKQNSQISTNQNPDQNNLVADLLQLLQSIEQDICNTRGVQL